MRVMFQAHHDRHDEHMQQVQMERREAGLVAAAASTIGSLFLLALALAIVADRVHISVGGAIFIVINGTFASIIVGMFTSHQVGYSKAMLASLPPWLLPQPQPTSQSHARIFPLGYHHNHSQRRSTEPLLSTANGPLQS